MLMARTLRRSTALIASEMALILGAVVLIGYGRLDQPRWPALFSSSLLPKALLVAVYSFYPSLVIGPGVFVASVALVAVLISSWRVSLEWANTNFGPHERLLLVGTNEAALALASELYDRRDLGVEIVGFIEPEG